MPAQPPFKTGSTYNTELPFLQEMQFRDWINKNKVPFNPEVKTSDYDMRGFWQGLQQGPPRAEKWCKS